MNERQHFNSEKDAVDWARQIAEKIETNGAEPEIPNDKLILARAYQALQEKLQPYQKTPEEAVLNYVNFLGTELIKQAKPFLKVLVGKWEEEKLTSKIRPLSKRTQTELKMYARYLIRVWGEFKATDITRKIVVEELNKLRVPKRNTRRKYLRYVRMFFIWLKDHGEIGENPTDGIRIKGEPFEARFYAPDTIKQILRYVLENEKDLIGYYALLTFAGLRPSEGARVEWQDIGFETGELYVRKGKKEARRFILQDTAMAWMKFHKANSTKDAPFVNLKNLPAREKKVRKVLNGEWIQDGLRHGMATYYNAVVQDPYKVAHVLGDNIGTVKRHYMRAVRVEDSKTFWGLTPDVVAQRGA